MKRLKIFFSQWRLILKNGVYHSIFLIISLVFVIPILKDLTIKNILTTLLNPLFLMYIIVFICCSYNFLKNIACSSFVYNYIKKVETNLFVTIRCGAPGSGKSASTMYLAVIIAKLMEYEIKFKFWLYNGLIKFKKYNSSTSFTNKYLEIINAYEFYNLNNGVWCLGSNVEFKVNGKNVYKITVDYIKQVKRLPFGMVCVFDELTHDIPLETYNIKKNKSTDEELENVYNLDDWFRLLRHFGLFHFLGCEQDEENVYINIRRVVHDNQYMISQKWILKPRFLILIQSILAEILPHIFKKSNRLITLLMYKFEKFNNSLGYRRFSSVSLGNAEHSELVSKGIIKQKLTNFYAFAPLNFEYDDRIYKSNYKCNGLDFDCSTFNK